MFNLSFICSETNILTMIKEKHGGGAGQRDSKVKLHLVLGPAVARGEGKGT